MVKKTTLTPEMKRRLGLDYQSQTRNAFIARLDGEPAFYAVACELLQCADEVLEKARLAIAEVRKDYFKEQN